MYTKLCQFKLLFNINDLFLIQIIQRKRLKYVELHIDQFQEMCYCNNNKINTLYKNNASLLFDSSKLVRNSRPTTQMLCNSDGEHPSNHQKCTAFSTEMIHLQKIREKILRLLYLTHHSSYAQPSQSFAPISNTEKPSYVTVTSNKLHNLDNLSEKPSQTKFSLIVILQKTIADIENSSNIKTTIMSAFTTMLAIIQNN